MITIIMASSLKKKKKKKKMLSDIYMTTVESMTPIILYSMLGGLRIS